MATHSPAADSLPYDILLGIFEMNADMFSDAKALNTARFTSQVCRSWRDIMLATPSIWAKLIDLHSDSSHPPHNTWSEELIRRSGTSLLWIKADISGYGPLPGLDFFFKIISQYWGRIQKLVAKIYCSDVPRSQYAPLRLPAPHLETFEFGYCRNVDTGMFTQQESPYLTVFSGQAPMLRRLDFEWHKPDPSAPWLHQLHFINLAWGSSVFSVLSATPNLQELKIFRADSLYKMVPPLPPLVAVALPNLRRISINELWLPDIACILDHLDIPPGCSLDIYVLTGSAYGDFPHIVNTISEAAQRYFQSHSPNKIFFDYSDGRVILQDSTRPDGFSLRIEFLTLRTNSPSHHFLAKLTSAEFPGVRELAYHIKDVSPSSFLTFASRFPLVETIRASERELWHLTHVQGLDDPESIQGGCKNIFPRLTTVIVDTARRQEPHNFRNTGSMTHDFALSRIEHGFPLSMVDLTPAIHVDPVALDLLRGIAGLEVLSKADNVGLISV